MILVTSFGCWCLCKKIEYVRDKNGLNRHQHLKVVGNIFRLQHPSPTSMWPIFQICCRSSPVPKFVYLDVNRIQCRFDAVVQARLEAPPLNPTCKTVIKRNEKSYSDLCIPILDVRSLITRLSSIFEVQSV